MILGRGCQGPGHRGLPCRADWKGSQASMLSKGLPCGRWSCRTSLRSINQSMATQGQWGHKGELPVTWVS